MVTQKFTLVVNQTEDLVIPLNETFVLFQNSEYNNINVYGHLIFDNTSDIVLKCKNLIIHQNGTLDIQPSDNCQHTIILKDSLLDLNDIAQIGNSIQMNGKVRIIGQQKDGYIRVLEPLFKGQTIIKLSNIPLNWKINDRLVIIQSDQYRNFYPQQFPFIPKTRENKIVNIEKNIITLETPLEFDYPGVKDDNGIRFVPHVANLSRNVVIKSENPLGTRGHTICTNRANIDIRYANFDELGRTKIYDTIIGRYPVHFHHLIGPDIPQDNGYQFTFIGNSISTSLENHDFRWAITIHDSHYGLISENVTYNWRGASIVCEDGNESYNLIEKNLTIKTRGRGLKHNGGNEGIGFWLKSPFNFIRNNIATDVYNYDSPEAAYGFQFDFMMLGNVKIPSYQGADIKDGEYIIVNVNNIPVLEFIDNECYAVDGGLTAWWINSDDDESNNATETILKNFKGWHITTNGYYGYPSSNIVFDNWILLNDKDALSEIYEFSRGIWFGDYIATKQKIKNCEIKGFRYGIVDPYHGNSDTFIEDSILQNNYDIVTFTLGSPGNSHSSSKLFKNLIVKNCRHLSTDNWDFGPAWGGHSRKHFARNYTTWYNSANLIRLDTLFVENYNNSGRNFKVYYKEQHPDFIIPQTTAGLTGSPEEGLTNQQNWDKYNIAIAGEVLPHNSIIEQYIHGYVF